MRLPTLLGLSLLMGGAADPRPELVELQLAGGFDRALQQTQRILDTDPAQAQEWGFEYLEGHLLERLQAEVESPISFADAMTSTPLLAGHARYRLAIDRYRAG